MRHHSYRVHIKFYTRTQDKSRNLMGSKARPPCSSWKASEQAGVAGSSPRGHRPWRPYWGGSLRHMDMPLLVATIWGPSSIRAQTWPYPTAFRHQHLDASGQTTKQGGGTDPSIKQTGFPKTSWRPQPSLDTPLDMVLVPQKLLPRPSSIHQWASPTEARTGL